MRPIISVLHVFTAFMHLLCRFSLTRKTTENWKLEINKFHQGIHGRIMHLLSKVHKMEWIIFWSRTNWQFKSQVNEFWVITSERVWPQFNNCNIILCKNSQGVEFRIPKWYQKCFLHRLRTRILFSLSLVLPVFQQKCELMIRIYVQ